MRAAKSEYYHWNYSQMLKIQEPVRGDKLLERAQRIKMFFYARLQLRGDPSPHTSLQGSIRNSKSTQISKGYQDAHTEFLR